MIPVKTYELHVGNTVLTEEGPRTVAVKFPTKGGYILGLAKGNKLPVETILSHQFDVWQMTVEDAEALEEERHEGHRSRLTGAWYCDTCNSPYCDLA